MTSPSRAYPTRPFLAASIAVFRAGKVLLAERVAAPAALRFSLPGGVVELGETLVEAALRELHEETGVRARVVGFNDHVEVIERDPEGRLAAHFVVASFVGLWQSGEGTVGPEARRILWVEPERIAELDVTPHLGPIVSRAAVMVREVRSVLGSDDEASRP